MRGSSFFEGIRQIDIEIGGQPGRAPTFYYDAGSMTAYFPARYAALRRLMPDPRFVPARLAPGIGIVAISALEYRDTDIGPYNELAIAVALNEPSTRPNFPGRALLDATSEQRHAFIEHLPVTTQVALEGGVDFYNFPKFLAAIDFADGTGGGRSCRLAEGREHILTLTAGPITTPRSARADLFCHLFMDGQPQSAQVKFNQLETGVCRRPGAATVALGERHPIARELDRLLVSRRSLQYELTPNMEAILFGPEHLTMPLLERMLRATGVVERPPVAG